MVVDVGVVERSRLSREAQGLPVVVVDPVVLGRVGRVLGRALARGVVVAGQVEGGGVS